MVSFLYTPHCFSRFQDFLFILKGIKVTEFLFRIKTYIRVFLIFSFHFLVDWIDGCYYTPLMFLFLLFFDMLCLRMGNCWGRRDWFLVSAFF